MSSGEKPADGTGSPVRSDERVESESLQQNSESHSDAVGRAPTDAARLLAIDSNDAESPPLSSSPADAENPTREPTDAEKLLRLDGSDSASDGPTTESHPGAEHDTTVIDNSATGFTDHRSVASSDSAVAVESTATADADADAVRTRILAEAAERAEQRLEDVCDFYGVTDRGDIAHVAEARDVIAATLAPLAVEGACRMLPKLREEIDDYAGTVFPVVNRDGTPVGLAIEQLDPDLYAAHCRPIHLSRKTSEEALQNDETHAGRSYPQLGDDLRDRDRADPAEIPGAAMRLERHLLLSGVEITSPGVRISMIDSGHKGSIQEALAARYPDATISGHYLFHTQSEADPHPGSKTGYFLHSSADRTFPADPDDPARIFEDKNPSFVYEQLLHGPMSTTRGYDDRGEPIQSFESPPTGQINPLLIAERYSAPQVRSAIAEIAQHAVADCARTVADLDRAGLQYRPALAEQADSCMRKIRDWAYGHDTGDPAFNTLADSFVRREDKYLVARLRETVDALGLGAAGTDAVWHGYQNLHPDDKPRYIEHLQRSMAPSSDSPTPEGTPHG
ncbi:hypothetical protein ACTD5D_19340 [Nocardia takedensis]|uniref:hypothetical protein n=1 Tax=Nocardia takedensis TaxID=259390 RepID=UPI003F761F64